MMIVLWIFFISSINRHSLKGKKLLWCLIGHRHHFQDMPTQLKSSKIFKL